MENSQQTFSGQTQTSDDGKAVAIVSYLSFIGWIIAFVLYGNNKTSLGAYHLRQTIALFIVAICTWIMQLFLIFIPFIGWIISILLIFVYIGTFRIVDHRLHCSDQRPGKPNACNRQKSTGMVPGN